MKSPLCFLKFITLFIGLTPCPATDSSPLSNYIESIKILEKDPWKSIHQNDCLIRIKNAWGSGTLMVDNKGTGLKYVLTARHVAEAFTSSSNRTSEVYFPDDEGNPYHVEKSFCLERKGDILDKLMTTTSTSSDSSDLAILFIDEILSCVKFEEDPEQIQGVRYWRRSLV
jgi:hypothetical protein